MASRAISSSVAISARCGNGPWLIRATPAARPFRLGRSAGESDDVQRQRRPRGPPARSAGDRPSRGTKKPLAPASAKALPRSIACIDQRVVIGLRLQEQIGAGVDEEGVARPPAGSRRSARPAASAGEVPRRRSPGPRNCSRPRRSRRARATFAAPCVGIDRIGALEIDRQRQLDRVDDPLRIGQSEVDRHLLPVGPAVGVGDRMAARRQRLGARAYDRLARCRRPRCCRARPDRPARAAPRTARTCCLPAIVRSARDRPAGCRPGCGSSSRSPGSPRRRASPHLSRNALVPA